MKKKIFQMLLQATMNKTNENQEEGENAGNEMAKAIAGVIASVIIAVVVIIALLVFIVLFIIWYILTNYSQCTIPFEVECKKPSNIYFEDPITEREYKEYAEKMNEVRKIALGKSEKQSEYKTQEIHNQGALYKEDVPVVDAEAVEEENTLKEKQKQDIEKLEYSYNKDIKKLEEEGGNEERINQLKDELKEEKTAMEAEQKEETTREIKIIEFKNKKRKEMQMFKDWLYDTSESAANQKRPNGGLEFKKGDFTYKVPKIEDLVDEATDVDQLTFDEKVDFQISEITKKQLKEIAEFEEKTRDIKTGYIPTLKSNYLLADKNTSLSNNDFSSLVVSEGRLMS